MRKRRFWAFLLAASLCFSLAACGNSSADGQQSGGTAEPNAPSDAAGGASAIDWAALKAASTEPNPKEFGGPTEPAKAPTGIKVALVPSDQALSGPAKPAAAIEAVGKNFDWTVQWFNGKGDPTEQNQAIMDAVSWGADAICCFSVDAASVQQGLTAAKDAGIPVVSASNGTDDPNEGTNTVSEGQLDYEFDVGVDYRALGVAIADWMVGDAGNQGSIVVYGAKEYPSCMATEYGLLDELAKSDMEISEVQYFTGGQVGDELNRQVIGYLQAHPEVQYVFMPYDPAAISVVDALSTAGYDDVKVCSILGTEQYQSLIAEGGCAAASAAYDMEYMGWGCADQLIRLLNGQELSSPHGENTPYCVIDSTNLTDSGDWATSVDYQAAFLKLWK
ncbi:MAG: sugar ABC transporter substrate-binding protein [Eubacteriales bacterium]|nr:sugar ABC transporter substrate-binding protein [Eubacteriales bacterium]